MQIIDGKVTAEEIKQEIAQEVQEIKKSGGRAPHLAAILVGTDGASQTYVNGKVKACDRVGFESTLIKLPEETTEEELLSEIAKLNGNDEIDGFIVQLPLPKHIDEQKVVFAINPDKDVDGFHPENFGKMSLGLPAFLPATPNGILELLKRYEIETSGKNCVVIGRSHIVGLPISILLGQNNFPGNCTVTMTHSRTKNLQEITGQADILVVALGKPDFVKANMIKEGAVVIDVGITRVQDSTRERGYRVTGDVDFEDVKHKASAITPVPGGVGPMTITCLIKNTLLSYKYRFNLS